MTLPPVIHMHMGNCLHVDEKKCSECGGVGHWYVIKDILMDASNLKVIKGVETPLQVALYQIDLAKRNKRFVKVEEFC